MGAPFVAADVVSISALKTASFNAADLQPDAQRAVLVREVVFSIISPDGVVGGVNTPLEWGGGFRVKMKAGPYEMIPEYVPIWLLQPRHHFYPDAVGMHSTYRWILPRPMWLPPGASVQAVCERGAVVDVGVPAGAGLDYKVRLALRGEYASARAPSSVVPFVSAFLPEAPRQHSTDRELKNTLDHPVEVHRLVGRILVHAAGTIFGNEATPSGTQQVPLTIRDSYGYAITSNQVTWDDVFPWAGRAWTFRRRLNPGENYVVALGAPPTATMRPMISLVGSREEVF
jgi:hypothetical protein